MRPELGAFLAPWPIQVISWTLAAHRENEVYAVNAKQGKFALRLHRPGYRTDRELRSELAYMQGLANAGFGVPSPICGNSGQLIEHTEGHQVSLLTWMDGKALGQSEKPLVLHDRIGFFGRFGELIAQLHKSSDALILPSDFYRQAWDVEGLLGENPQWGRFWENPLLTTEECDLMKAARDALQAALMNSGAEQGLIHGDLVSENVLLNSARINFIDFDDCGLGFRAQDLATALVKYLHEPDFNDLKRALLDGYRMHKPMNDSWVEQFLLMRHLSYLGWIVPRMANAGGEARCRHFIALAIPMARRYLLNPAQFKVS